MIVSPSIQEPTLCSKATRVGMVTASLSFVPLSPHNFDIIQLNLAGIY